MAHYYPTGGKSSFSKNPPTASSKNINTSSFFIYFRPAPSGGGSGTVKRLLRPTLIVHRFFAKLKLNSILTFSFAKGRLIVKSGIRLNQTTKVIDRISQN
jgi:hypothetical protein